jgi:hypothetical protein
MKCRSSGISIRAQEPDDGPGRRVTRVKIVVFRHHFFQTSGIKIPKVVVFGQALRVTAQTTIRSTSDRPPRRVCRRPPWRSPCLGRSSGKGCRRRRPGGSPISAAVRDTGSRTPIADRIVERAAVRAAFPHTACLGCMTARLAVYAPAPVSREPGSESSACFAGAHSPWPLPFAPPTPPQIPNPGLHCSPVSPLL